LQDKRAHRMAKSVRVASKSGKSALEALSEAVINGIREKKGKEIVILDLRQINGSVCDLFIICQADSGTQVEAIARGVEEQVFKASAEWPKNVEGKSNAQWILLDYFNVVVHVFLSEARAFYGLEKVWADAPAQHIEEN